MIFDRVMTQIFDPKQKTKLADITPNVLKSKKGPQLKLIFWVVEFRKKLKIANFTEAPIMVKSDIGKNTYFFFNICALIPE